MCFFLHLGLRVGNETKGNLCNHLHLKVIIFVIKLIDLFHQSKFRVPISFLSSIKYYIHLMSFAVFYFGKNLFAREVIGLFSVTLLCKCNITFSLNFTGESGVNLLNPLLNLIDRRKDYLEICNGY